MKQKYFPNTSANLATKGIMLRSALNMNCESQVTSNVYQSTSFMMISVIHYAFKYMLQRGNIVVRLTESGNARSEQLLVMPREQIAN